MATARVAKSQPTIHGDASTGGREPKPPPAANTTAHKWPSSHGFAYMATEERWDVVKVGEKDGEAQYEILPHLLTVHFTPGVNGVVHVKGANDGDPSATIGRLQAKGYKLVPMDMTVTAFGQDYTGYVHVYDGAYGEINLPRWVRLYRLGDTTYQSRDGEGWVNFLRWVRDNLLPEPKDEVRLALVGQLEQVRRLAAGNLNSPSAKEAAGIYADKIKAAQPRRAPAGGRSAKPPPKAEAAGE